MNTNIRELNEFETMQIEGGSLAAETATQFTGDDDGCIPRTKPKPISYNFVLPVELSA